MKTFDEVISDIEKLKGLRLESLSGKAAPIRVVDVDREAQAVILNVEDVTPDGSQNSRPFDEFRKIYNVLKQNKLAHVDSILSGSGSSRNRPETVLASLPYIKWTNYGGKKRLAYVGKDVHDFGKTMKMTEEEARAFTKEEEDYRPDHVDLSFFTGYKSNFERNRIIFGAPGTGKSFELDQDRVELLKENENKNFERVTFHPSYTYSQFVGSYKPVTDEKGEIAYKYVPGPFMRILVAALKNEIYAEAGKDSVKPYLLIIEEINRARVAAVLGDVFQMLDRDSQGTSTYDVQVSEDIRRHLSEKLGGKPEDFTSLRLPDNLFIWASMNSADQGVYPMDTAFKRRWDFEYLGVDDNDSKIEDSFVHLVDGDEDSKVDWNQFRKAINRKLTDELHVEEDRLLGPFFLSGKIIAKGEDDTLLDEERFRKAFKNKVLMYLYDDAAKQGRPKMFSGCDSGRYSSVCKAFDSKGMAIFGDNFEEDYYDKA